MVQPLQRILGIDFFVGNIECNVDKAVQGGLVVVPAAPALAKDFMQSSAYREALLSADLVITDSGFMLIAWLLRTGKWLPKNSGVAFLREFIKRDDFRNGKKLFWVMPSVEEQQRTCRWLETQGVALEETNFYVAPFYGKGTVNDMQLLAKIEAQKPDVIMIGLGGGVQERLGLFLKRNLSGRPCIFCIGAAIAFLTGGQAVIPVWVDKLFLGWFFRIIQSPKRFWRRYWNAFRLALIIWKYQEQLPPMNKSNE
ncbi:MAG: WecB/TagA/CpsF family glycosyltransferase [Prevotellaceae bacterium]|jgi:UDP-N-acetyl-D-mannosaminuronic acid transferase (WecB/TagA/CpsF family)|nr:WecB/TagA/CpsF family glycosyltransferase [Prevotellaceae bacterium]